MATFEHNLMFTLICVVILVQSINCKPVKRSAMDCYGTDCIIPQEELDFRGNPRDTMLIENITASVFHAIPEITDLLSNIVHIHENATATALSSIAQSLEDVKNLQISQNLLIENGTAVMTPIILEMVRLMQNQQEMHESQQEIQERHNQQMQERVDRQYLLLAIQQAMQERYYQWMQEQSERQNRLTERVTTSFQQTSLPQPTIMSQIPHSSVPYSCKNGLSNGQHIILPNNTALGSFPVVCDMDTDRGGWIVFQRRYDGSLDFDRVWDDYATGFGNPDGEFWLGLNKLHVLTSHGRWELRVDLEDFDLNKAYAIYDNFGIGDNSSFYRLDIGSYSGTAGDSMRRSSYGGDLNGMAFTTKDQDHDQHSSVNCAIRFRGAWWHNRCSCASLNGLYLVQDYTSLTCMFWYEWKKNWQSLKKSELKIRLIEG